MKKFKLTIPFFVILLITVQPEKIFSQAFGNNQDVSTPRVDFSAGPTVYQFTQAKGVQIDVNLWGFVGRPGKHYISYVTNLIDLLSVAGGPDREAKLDEIRIIRYSNQDTTIVERVLRVDIDRFIETGDMSGIPVLLRGDTIIVPGGTLNLIRDFNFVLQTILGLMNFTLILVTLRNR
ncbi:MAG: hypothetical protein SFU91_00430 [Chloroherpetonaceae bacterium]|nr:hypothetical protein [Chloroherpetonaceae bacterium]